MSTETTPELLPTEPTLSDVTVGAANYMLGYLQMTIAAGDSITPKKWKKALDETLAFQKRMIEIRQPLE